MDPTGTFQCMKCNKLSDGTSLVLDQSSQPPRHTCGHLPCDGFVEKISHLPLDKYTEQQAGR